MVAGNPWSDDVLGRREIAERLTKLIQFQREPYVISIDGDWGTGKTFLLKRWQASLEQQGFNAIYFNAWEDDFCDDPQLAILGQLAEYFREGRLKNFARQAFDVATPLLRQIPIALAQAMLQCYTGLPTNIDISNMHSKERLDEYLTQRRTKDELKRHLERLAEEVLAETERPLVFIVDELDRCRPTFAIELLERVKHIFGVPNVVFVVGVNRMELCSALKSVYGDIHADVYVRRFFDSEFILPEADSSQFSKHLMGRFKLTDYFAALSRKADGSAYADEFSVLFDYIPVLWTRFELSLRDVDYCVRMISIVGKSLSDQQYMFPWLLGLIIPLKLKNPDLYRQFVQGNCHASEIMDYVDNIVNLESPYRLASERVGIERVLEIIESQLYRAESQQETDPERPTAIKQLRLQLEDNEVTHPQFLSERTQKSDKKRIERLLKPIGSETMFTYWDNIIDRLGMLVDLHQPTARR